MNFDLPTIINDIPKIEDYKSSYKGFHLKIVHKVAIKVYWRTRLSEAQNHRCCWCGCNVTELRDKKNSATIEHVLPRSFGGADHPDNYAIACHDCNQKRGVTEVDIFMRKSAATNALKKTGIKFNKDSKPCRLNTKLLQIQVRHAIEQGAINPYAVGSKAHRMFERYIQRQDNLRPLKMSMV
jgi:hypothetical protein